MVQKPFMGGTTLALWSFEIVVKSTCPNLGMIIGVKTFELGNKKYFSYDAVTTRLWP
jgi:hypothetical protein